MCTEHSRQLTSKVTRRTAMTGAAAVAATAALGGTAEAGDRGDRGHAFGGKHRRLRDLTYPLTTSFPAFVPGEEAVRRTTVTIENDGYYLQEWRIIEHIGTHLDAPGHFTAGGRLATELELSELIVPAVVVDISAPRRRRRRRGGDRGRPAPVRAPVRPDPARLGRADVLRLG